MKRTRGGPDGGASEIAASGSALEAADEGAAAMASPSTPRQAGRRRPRSAAPSGAPGTSSDAEGLALELTQPVHKKNDRTPDISLTRPALFVDPSTGVSTLYTGNGLFPLYVDIRASTAEAMAILTHTKIDPPTVR